MTIVCTCCEFKVEGEPHTRPHAMTHMVWGSQTITWVVRQQRTFCSSKLNARTVRARDAGPKDRGRKRMMSGQGECEKKSEKWTDVGESERREKFSFFNIRNRKYHSRGFIQLYPPQKIRSTDPVCHVHIMSTLSYRMVWSGPEVINFINFRYLNLQLEVDSCDGTRLGTPSTFYSYLHELGKHVPHICQTRLDFIIMQ